MITIEEILQDHMRRLILKLASYDPNQRAFTFRVPPDKIITEETIQRLIDDVIKERG
jgi:hypothetical protein